jgi:Flp pilus assembly protein TadD
MAIRVLILIFGLGASIPFLSGQGFGDASTLRRLGAAELTSVRGQVSADGDIVFSELVAELCDAGDMNRIVDRTTISGSGEFFLAGVPERVYTVRITSRSGVVLAEQLLSSSSTIVRIEIHSAHKENALAGSVISLAELKHKVPGGALKEAKEANKALKKRDMQALILHLEKALAIDPGFIAARRNLANTFLATKQFDRAIDAYRELLVLDSHSIVAYMGISTAYMSTYHVKEAEEPARKALEIDSSSELSHYLLGCSLAAQDKDRSEALMHLRKASKSFRAAQLIAARILALEGRKDEAKIQLQSYLDSGDDYGRTEAERLLNSLE